MDIKEKQKKLESLPWQALFDTAIKMQIDAQELKGKEKEKIVEKIISNGIDNECVQKLVNDYIYGDRVTFTLWSFNHALTDEEIDILRKISGEGDFFIDISGFRNLKVLSVEKTEDRLEILYTYSKEYLYIDENEKASSIWELHRGCLWVGLKETYLACISKHDKMTKNIVRFIANKIKNPLKQIKMPKVAIDKCTDPEAISRVVLQGMQGEKTTISKAGGITDEQQAEIDRIKDERINTSGSYIARVAEEKTATIRYNMNKGSIGIYKHLSAEELFSWTSNAISIILEEIENLKGKPAEQIFSEMGMELKWKGFDASLKEGLNWYLSQLIYATSLSEPYQVNIDEKLRNLLENEKYFLKIPRVYCNECETYEIPICGNCGELLHSDSKGKLTCTCDAPLSITCAEKHKGCCELRYWYVPKDYLKNAVNKQINLIYKDEKLDYSVCVMDDLLNVSFVDKETYPEVEIPFMSIEEFAVDADKSIEHLREYALKLKEKCTEKCSIKKIEQCIQNINLVCLPKIFCNVIPGFRMQPHGVKEYGDISGQVTVGRNHFQMKGIIKSNTQNKKDKTTDDMLHTHFRSTSKAGEEMIRQFVEQGMNDARCDLILVVVPQYYDNDFKGTLRYLAKLGNKKVCFIGLDEVCKILSLNEERAL